MTFIWLFSKPEQNRFFTDEKLCKCRCICRCNVGVFQNTTMCSGGICNFYISGDTTKVTVYKNNLPLSITHIVGSGKFF